MFQLVKNINRAQRSNPKVFTFLLKKCSLEWMSLKNDNRSEEAVSKSVCPASGRLGVRIPLSLIWRRHHDRWSAANFDLCSALIAIERWGVFSIPHLLWHGASVYNGHLRGPVTLTPLPSCWQWSCHYLFLRLRSVTASLDIQILMITSNFHLYIGHICMHAVRMSVCI